MRNLALMLLLCLIAPSALASDVCDMINDIANGWNEVANYLDKVGDKDLSERQSQELENYVTELATGTYELADALVDEGNNTETKLGVQMRKQMNAIANAKEDSNMVAMVDSLVDTLDKTTDYCDSVNE